MDNNNLITPADVAEMSEGLLQAQTIHKYCQKGVLKAEKVRRRWQIRPEDARQFIEDYRAGLIGRKGFASPDHPHYGKGRPVDPDSILQTGGFTHIYLPCDREHGSWLVHTLAADERLAILDKFAELKESGRDIGEILENLS